MAREVSLSRQMTTVHPRNVPVPLILHVLAVGQNSRCAAVEDGPRRVRNHRLERWVKETLVNSLLA